MTRRIPALAVVLALLAIPVLAGCGSGYGSSSNDTGSATAPQPTRTAATVKTSNAGGLGTILVDAHGRTIYLFQRDSGPTSTCSGACLAQWPAVTTHGRPLAGGSATAAQLGVTKRGDGTTQVTYAGHPLYYYAGDGAAGDTNGQGLNFFGARWYAMDPSGSAITTQASGGGGSGGSGGYGY